MLPRYTCLTLLLLVWPVVYCTAEETKTPEQWVAAIRAEAEQPLPAGLAELRLGAGVYITHGYGEGETDVRKYRFPEACAALRDFMRNRGETILDKILAGEQLNSDDEPYRHVVLAVHLWTGHNEGAKSHSQRFYQLPLDADGLQQAKDFHDRIVDSGPKALREGYLTGKLTGEQVETIRLYRIAQGMRGVGECFLPSHLGLHPSSPTESIRGAGHGVPSINRANIGRPYFDLMLPRLEAIRAGAGYTDEPNYRYGYEYPLRDEGVLEFIEPMVGYTPGKNEQGQPFVVVRPAEPDADSVAIGSLVGEKPVMLMMNDGVDAPLLRAISLVPVLMQAWQQHVRWQYVAVNIHDWHYASSHYNDYLSKENWGTQHHAWSPQERARRFSMRLIQCPHIRVPALVDTRWQTCKDRYASGGGQNSFWLIDTDGTLVHRNGGPFHPLNEVNAMEHALSRLLSGGGGKGVLPREPDSRTRQAAEPTVVLHDAKLTAVDAANGSLKAVVSLDDQETDLRLDVSPHTRILLDGELASLADLQPGDRLQARCFLASLGDFSTEQLPEPTVPWEKPGAARLTSGDRQIELRRVQDGYVADYDLFLLSADSSPQPLRPRLIRAWRKKNVPGLATRDVFWPDHVIIWRGGRVTAIDSPKRLVTVTPWSVDTQALTGWSMVRQLRAAGKQLYLDPIAEQRLACVDRWIATEGQPMRLQLDDAVDYTLNGLFDAGFDDLRVGDALTIRYECRYDGDPTIRPEMVRISRP